MQKIDGKSLRTSSENAQCINNELNWIGQIITGRIESYFSGADHELETIDPPDITDSHCHYASFVKKYGLSPEERTILIIALAPEIKPQLLDIFQTKNQLYDYPYSEFGGVLNHGYAGFLPTIQTALFILAGNDMEKQIDYLALFDVMGTLYARNILDWTYIDPSDRLINTRLSLSKSTVHYLLYGTDIRYEYSMDFPATLLDTGYNWDDLVLSVDTKEQISELEIWLRYNKTLLTDWQLASKIKPGYRVLFYGPPGTGKTLTAALLGKRIGQPVYRIDLSQILSKFIGETEKNLEKIFRCAEQKDWILFFDEADSLFSKRTGITSSNDRHANQETAYLLQRIEDCKNVIILASNFKQNLDKAFIRRFQSIINFPMPAESERLLLWEKSRSEHSSLADDVNIKEIAHAYKLSGAAIMNVIRYASLMAVNRDSTILTKKDLLTGIKRELYNEGKMG